jgi:hypothetical protein
LGYFLFLGHLGSFLLQKDPKCCATFFTEKLFILFDKICMRWPTLWADFFPSLIWSPWSRNAFGNTKKFDDIFSQTHHISNSVSRKKKLMYWRRREFYFFASQRKVRKQTRLLYICGRCDFNLV